jgi:hypothetical protein
MLCSSRVIRASTGYIPHGLLAAGNRSRQLPQVACSTGCESLLEHHGWYVRVLTLLPPLILPYASYSVSNLGVGCVLGDEL